MKSCKNCKWFIKKKIKSSTLYRCIHPNNTVKDLVDESTHYVNSICGVQRQYGWFFARFHNVCGKEGRWFEPTNTSKKLNDIQ